MEGGDCPPRLRMWYGAWPSVAGLLAIASARGWAGCTRAKLVGVKYIKSKIVVTFTEQMCV